MAPNYSAHQKKIIQRDYEHQDTSVIDRLIREDQTECAVLETEAEWFGVTYPEDKPAVQAAIKRLIEQGAYPERLV